MKRVAAAIAFATIALAGAPRAHAFCGFYVGGAGRELFNHATQVVMMRVGTHTVLSMENNYDGPPDGFAMVVPVPVVLHEENVKTLEKEVFDKVDVMGSPRLVEYWEQDPCAPEYYPEEMAPMMGGAMEDDAPSAAPENYGVKIEAKFAVGEYQIVILSATQSTGLADYLHDQHYAIPDGAAPLLRPYVESGSKFFVAKVDPKKVKFANGMATLSPLRFDYDSDEFSLPIRLGLANSAGTQDLIVSILAPQRFQVANYDNVTIPTNLDVKDEVRDHFAEFYAALFDRTLQLHPKAVVTEYAWDASSCDPCPGPQLDYDDFATLGADIVGEQGFTLTRLHARYGKDDMKSDLVFAEAPAIVGGREYVVDDKTGKLEQGARQDPESYNNFQARYIIRHRWTKAITCDNPIRNRWGGPWDNTQEIAASPATNTAFAPRGQMQLPMVVAQDVPEIGVTQGVPLPTPPKVRAHGCACTTGEGGAGLGVLALGVGFVIIRRRKR